MNSLVEQERGRRGWFASCDLCVRLSVRERASRLSLIGTAACSATCVQRWIASGAGTTWADKDRCCSKCLIDGSRRQIGCKVIVFGFARSVAWIDVK
jgi:hypothetical protein